MPETSEIAETKTPEPEKDTPNVEQDLKEDKTVESESKDKTVDDKALKNEESQLKINEQKDENKNKDGDDAEPKPAPTLSEGLSKTLLILALIVHGI